jgi:hypothetical protein
VLGKLEVVVSSELTLDAGWWVETTDAGGVVSRIVHPPERTMFSQVVDYLDGVPSSAGDSRYLPPEALAVVTAAVCWRWGSYFAVLADRNKPLARQVKGPDYHLKSLISDGEMARINIEASAALAHWFNLRRETPTRFEALANRAAELLPVPRRTVKGWPEIPAFWAVYKVARDYAQSSGPAEPMRPALSDELAGAEANPARFFANALINYSWRNGSGVEAIHSGRRCHLALSHRRIRPADERGLFRNTALCMKEGLEILLGMMGDWSTMVLPFSLSGGLVGVVPNGWTLTGETHTFCLPGAEEGGQSD